MPAHRSLCPPILSAARMAAWDRDATGRHGVSERILLESAGRAAADRLHHHFAEGTFVFLLGKGNNGGDGLVAARTLRARGRDVVCVEAMGGALDRPDLLHGWEIPTASFDTLRSASGLARSCVVVDAMLGTGAREAPREPLAALIREANASGAAIVALDGPTGVDLSTGTIPGDAISARLTLTFGALKAGHLREPGRSRAGAIEVLEIGLPPLEDDAPEALLVTDAWVRERIPRPPPTAHKGTLGRVAVVAGTAGMVGAAIMIAHAALRTGVGLVTVLTRDEGRTAINGALPEAIVRTSDPDEVRTAADRADVVIIGPGIGTDDRAEALLDAALEASDTPAVLDADALTILARRGDGPMRQDGGVLTPHPGEAARLLDVDVEDVVRDHWGAARELAARYEAPVLLKGRPSVIAAPGHALRVVATGHVGVASGGMGDTLCGLIGALIARGMPAAEAAAAGTHIAGRAAEAAGRGVGLLPRDLAEAIPSVLAAPPEGVAPPDDGVVCGRLPAPR